MKHLSLIILVLSLLFGGAGTAFAGGSKVAKYMGNLRWGMTESEVIRHLENGIRKHFKGSEARRMLRSLEDGTVYFEGGRSRWDESVIKGEFAHGNGEAMIYFDAGSHQSYYFFIEGKLWKWVKTINAGALGGNNFKKVGKTLSKRFGRGRVAKGERNGASGKQRWYEYRDRNTRLRAVDVTDRFGQYALVFAELDTTRQLASLRPNSSSKASRSDRAVTRATAPTGGIRSNRRSVFHGEKKQESDAEYRQRVKREQDRALAKQRRAHERKKLKKRGKALKGVKTESDDPLAGI